MRYAGRTAEGWRFPALSLGSLLVWCALFAASGVALVVNLNDVVEVAHADDLRLRLIARIDAIDSALRYLEVEAGEYILHPTSEHGGAYVRAQSEMHTKVRALVSDDSLGFTRQDIEIVNRSLAHDLTRIDTAVSRRRAGKFDAADLVLIGADGTSRFPLDEPSRQLRSLSADAEQRLRSDNRSLEEERQDVVWSFACAGLLGLLFQVWVYLQMRREWSLRDRLQQELTEANTRLNDRVLERTRELDDRNQELAFVTRKVLEMQESERRSLALELHDDIGQDLAGVNMLLRSIVRDGAAERRRAAAPVIAECIEATQAIYRRVGDMALTLRPSILDRLGFAAALNWHARQVAKRSNCRVTVSADATPDDLSEITSIAAFRIVQEAISNAIRHARTQDIQVQVCCTQQMFCLCISDDGAGFDLPTVVRDPDPHSGFGILGMKERARIAGGSLVVDSAPGCGTRVSAEFPLSAFEGSGNYDSVGGAAPAQGTMGRSPETQDPIPGNRDPGHSRASDFFANPALILNHREYDAL